MSGLQYVTLQTIDLRKATWGMGVEEEAECHSHCAGGCVYRVFPLRQVESHHGLHTCELVLGKVPYPVRPIPLR